IGATEVTVDDYLAYLDTLPPAERARRRPHASDFAGAVDVDRDARGTWSYSLTHADVIHRARRGEPFHYDLRAARADQDWGRFPVAGVSLDDARAYCAWRAITGVAGARLCTDEEWERAARGADDRIYPHGDRLDPADADQADTYGAPAAMGPDVVGSYPASDSPFGVHDLTGNVFELVDSPPHVAVLRGGGWFSGGNLSLRVTARSGGAPDQRASDTGFRVCAAAR
ncbi:MAG TPA: SUMF1/EgtB/PvdO family nonheme iron enzyme, partial [Kofleriaceae bacterium]|nr:SUMF1/EgtB/PvdO family nonheme iron enzyme [Kofleriaceae bacterium]